MTFFECGETARAGGLRLLRRCAVTAGLYDLCEPFENGKGWTWLDAVTANVVCQVHDALSPDQREKFEALPAKVILDFCWKIANRT